MTHNQSFPPTPGDLSCQIQIVSRWKQITLECSIYLYQATTTTKAEDRLSDVKGHAEVRVSDPLTESHAEAATATSPPPFP